MQLELVVTNDRRVLPSVRAFVRETLRQLPLPADTSAGLEELVAGAVDNAALHAYPDGEEGSIELTFADRHGRLEILVRDYGMPQDVDRMEHDLHAVPSAAAALFGCPTARLVDEAHWLAYGPQGKALQLRKWLHLTSIADRAEELDLKPFHEDVPEAPQQQYTVRRMAPHEAVDVSQLLYRSYGNTYFNADVYYPDRIAAQNANGSVLSFVAEADDGSIVGHSALELNQRGPVAENGQAVVDPAHRGRGLLSRLRDVAVEEAGRLDLVGWYADAVGVHARTQKSNVDHGGQLTCVDLAISPKTEVFRGFGGEQPQRVTCLMYFHWLKSPSQRTVHVPSRHREIVATIYDRLQCPVQYGTPAAPSGHGTLAVKVASSAALAVVRADQLGSATAQSIRHAKRELVEQARVEVVYVELPMEDPGTPAVSEALEGEGFALAGIAPHFSPRGDLLRLVYLVEPLAREAIKTYDEPANDFVNYALAEQNRVRSEV
jgi:anti-sigma regulatory factor (Ser/Thr protein kinase)/GNAT superfamily N-acetyltransferase